MVLRVVFLAGVFLACLQPGALAQDTLEGTYRLRRWEFGPSHHLYVKVWITQSGGKLTLTRQVGRDPANVLSAPIERLDGDRLRARLEGEQETSVTAVYTISNDGRIEGYLETADPVGNTARTQESGVRISPEPLPQVGARGPASLTLQFLSALETGFGAQASQAARRALIQHYASEAKAVQGDGPLTFAEEELVSLARADKSMVDVSQLPRIRAAIDANAPLAGQAGALVGVSAESLAGVYVSQIRTRDVPAARAVANALVDLYLPAVRGDLRNRLPLYSGPRSVEESQLVAVLMEVPEISSGVDLTAVPWVRLALEGSRQ